jgi:hypothetical protein
VLLAACKCPDVAVTVGDSGFERDWARCLYILHHYEDQITSATQAIQVLEVMKQSVSGNGFPSQRKLSKSFLYESSSACSHIFTATPVQQHIRSQYPNHAMLPPQPQPMPPIATTSLPDYTTMPVDLQGVNPFMPGMDSMSEAWFGQQLLNMDWLDPNMPLQQST